MAALLAAGMAMGLTASAAWPEEATKRPVLRILNWEVYIDVDPDVPEDAPMTERSPTLRDFAKQFDCDIVYDEFHTQEDLFTKFVYMGDYYDIFVFPSALATPVIQAGWGHPIPKDKVPNLKYVDESAMSSPADPDGRYLVPYLHSYTGLIYHKDKIDGKDVSWRNYLDPATSWYGHIIMQDSPSRMFSIALVAGGVTNYGEPTQQELQEAHKQLAAFYRDSRPTVTDNLDMIQDALVAEELWLAPIYSSDAHYMFNFTTNYAFVIPPEGGMLDHDYMIVHRNSQNPELAFAFINYILTPEISGRIAADIGAEASSAAARRIQQEIAPLPILPAINEQGEYRSDLLTSFNQPPELAAYWYDILQTNGTPNGEAKDEEEILEAEANGADEANSEGEAIELLPEVD